MMSVSSECCAYGCRNRPDYKLPGITFHVFPKDPVRRKAWIEAVRKKNIPDFEPLDYTKICSEHFREECFDRSKKRVFLLAHAVPTIFGTPKSTPNVKHPLAKIYSNGAVKRKLSESEDEDDIIFREPSEDEDEYNKQDNASSSSSSDSPLEESEPEETPETEVVYVSEEAMSNYKPSIIKVAPGQSQPAADPDLQSALWAYRRLRSVAPSPSKQVSVLFMEPPHPDALPPLPPGTRLPRTPGTLEYRVWNQMKKLRSLKEEHENMVKKINELERAVDQFRNPDTSDEGGDDEDEDVSEGEAYRLLLKYQREKEAEEQDEDS